MINNLETVMKGGENNTVEFMENPDKDLPNEVCAFANASGGKIYLGIHDNGYIVGTDTSNSARARVQDTINKVEPRLNIGFDVADNVIILTVPEGTNKPYSCPAGFYLRIGALSQKLQRDSIIAMLQNEGISRYDSIIRDDLPIDERFNDEAYQWYLKTAKISNVLDKSSTLKNLNCAGESDGRLCFTNAGALFFRKNDEDILFRHAGIVCALYKGVNKVHILDTKELNGGLVSNIDDAKIFLKKHLRLKYKIENSTREDILELPERMLHEGVVNAVCHRDLFEVGARVMVEIFDDRVDIVSPGGVPKGITTNNFGTVSITRNSVIAALLHRINYIEQMGTGIERMRDAAREAEVAEPEFELNNFFKVTLRRSTLDISSDTKATASDTQATVSDRKRLQATASDIQATFKRH